MRLLSGHILLSILIQFLFPLSAQPSSLSSLTYHVINPVIVDSSITFQREGFNHIVGYSENTDSKGKLLVFLPATWGNPNNYKLFMKEAARKGYHVIALMYPNQETVGRLCGNHEDDYGKVRKVVCQGGTVNLDKTDVFTIEKPDCIETRLLELLKYLGKNYPDEEWSDFLLNGNIDWAKTVLAGFSQGAGHAAWLAHVHQVAGVLLFSGVVDAVPVLSPNRSVTWIENAVNGKYFGRTPVANFRFFENEHDFFYPAIQVNLTTMDVVNEGILINSDNPTGIIQSPVIITDYRPGSKLKAHASTIEDSATPLNRDGTAKFSLVWDYFLDSF